MKTPFW